MTGDNIRLPSLNSTYRLRGRDYLVAFSSGERIRLEDINSNSSKTYNPEKFNDFLLKGELTLVAESCMPQELQAFKSLNPKQKTRKDRRLHYVKFFQEEFSSVLKRSEFPDNIKRAAAIIDDKNPPSYSAVSSWVARYLSSKNAPLSLMDQHMYVTKRARRISEQIDVIIKKCIEEVFLKEEAPTEAHVYSLILAQIADFNKRFNCGEPLSQPAVKTMRARIDELDPFHRIERRYGKYAHNKRNRRGRPLYVEAYIGSRCEMDSQLVDVLIRSPGFDDPIRPYLTVVLDVITRCILGYEFSLLSPSAAKSMKALRDAVTKDPFIPTRAIPHKLYVDNGCEFANQSLASSVEALGINLTFCSPRQADQKAHVERLFGTFNTMFFHNLKGTTKSSVHAKGDYDSEGACVLTMEELKENFRKFIYQVYHNEKHSELGMSPLARWQQLVAQRPPRTVEESVSKGLFLIPREVSINRGRVRAFGLQWQGPGLPTLEEHLIRSRQKVKVILEIDPDAIGQAYVLDPTKKMPAQLVKCTLDEKYHTMSLAQFKAIRTYQREQGKVFDQFTESVLRDGILQLHQWTSEKVQDSKSKRVRKAFARKNLQEIDRFVDKPPFIGNEAQFQPSKQVSDHSRVEPVAQAQEVPPSAVPNSFSDSLNPPSNIAQSLRTRAPLETFNLPRTQR